MLIFRPQGKLIVFGFLDLNQKMPAEPECARSGPIDKVADYCR